MRLRDHFPDSERYLAHDCYCPGEVYDLTGFFYVIYSGGDWFTPLIRTDGVFEGDGVTWIGLSRGEFLLVTLDGERVVDMQRVPVSPANWRFFVETARLGEPPDDLQLEPDDGTVDSMRRLLSMTSGIVVRD